MTANSFQKKWAGHTFTINTAAEENVRNHSSRVQCFRAHSSAALSQQAALSSFAVACSLTLEVFQGHSEQTRRNDMALNLTINSSNPPLGKYTCDVFNIL